MDEAAEAQVLQQAIGLHRAGQLAEADQLYAQLLLARPRHAEALYYQAGLRLQQSRASEAVALFRTVTELQPGHSEAWLNLGVAYKAQRDLAQALKCFEQVVALRPDHAGAHYNLGVVQQELGLAPQALSSFDRAIQLRPNHAPSHNNRGVVLQSLGLHPEALASFEKALSLRMDAPALNARGHQLFQAGRLEEALHAFDQAIALDSGSGEAHCNRGSTLIRLDRFSEALQSCERAAALSPQNASAHDYCGVALTQLGRYEEALRWHDRAVALSPDDAALHSNRAATLVRLERVEEALADSERAIALAPEFANAHVNRGYALTKLGRHAAALEAYERGLALEPSLADAHLGRGYTLQLMGELRASWEEFDFRWKQPFAEAYRHRDIPVWRGDAPLAGQRILLWSEQGFGDTLQFCRYVPLVAALGAQVYLEVQPSHRELLRRLSGVSRVFAQGEPLPPCDLQAPLMDLPLAFDTRLETIPARIPYLSADPSIVARWQERLERADGPRIGLVCSGNPRHKNDASRSIQLAQLLPLMEIGDWTFLQRDVRPADEPALEPGRLRDLRSDLIDFAQTAAVVACMDLVVSVDTAAAHLAGAMGKPVWIMLPYVPDCRWLLERADSPWYPTARLFRQEALNEWSAVIARVRAALEHFCRSAA